jgi:hypothetical protein
MSGTGAVAIGITQPRRLPTYIMHDDNGKPVLAPSGLI